jgi:hypothetical protein
MADAVKLSFAKDIRPMFTDTDVKHMKSLGLDLGDWNAVKAQADAIYGVVARHVMPPASSGEPPWTADMCERFKQWQDDGCPP